MPAQLHAAHLLCAAHEAPLEPADADVLGPGWREMAEVLVGEGALRRRPDGTYVPRRPDEFPAAGVSLRSASGDGVAVVDTTTGELIGTVDAERAPSTVHAGAVYLHGGRSFEVSTLDLFEQAGVQMPGDKATWDDWAKAAKAVADKVKAPFPIAIDRSGHRFLGMAISEGAGLFDAKGDPVAPLRNGRNECNPRRPAPPGRIAVPSRTCAALRGARALLVACGESARHPAAPPTRSATR